MDNRAKIKRYYGRDNLIQKSKIYANKVNSNYVEYFKSFLPLINWIKRYNVKWFIGDLISGITISLMLIPQSIAYAKLADLDPKYGLYSSFLGAIIYGIFGTSREVSVGPTAILSLMTGEIIKDIISLSNKELDKIQVNVVITIVIGLIFLFISFFKLGLLMDLIPKPILIGFTSGASLTIIQSQIPNIIGFKFEFSKDIINLFKEKFNQIDFIFGILGIIFLIKFKYYSKIYNVGFIKYVLILSNVFCVLFFSFLGFIIPDLFEFKLTKVEIISLDFKPELPSLDLFIWRHAFKHCIPLALIGLLEHISVTKTFSKKYGYQTDNSQEIFSIGLGNVLSSIFGSFPTVGSLSRSAAQSNSGACTPFASIITGLMVLLFVFLLSPFLSFIPIPTLAAIIIISAISLITELSVFHDLWKLGKMDCIICVTCLLCTFIFGVEIGVIISFSISLLSLLFYIARPKITVLEQLESDENVFVDKFHPIYSTICPIKGVIIFKLEGPLIFANSEYFKNIIKTKLVQNTQPHPNSKLFNTDIWSNDFEQNCSNSRNLITKKYNNYNTLNLPLLKGVIFDFGSVSYIDYSGIDTLVYLKQYILDYAGIELLSDQSKESFSIYYTSLNPKVLALLEKAKLLPKTLDWKNFNLDECSNSDTISISDKIDFGKFCFSINEALLEFK